MDLARAPRRRPLTARKKGSGYENVNGAACSTSTSFPGSLGKTLVSAGHVPRPKLIARGGVVKVSNYKQLKT